MLISEGVAGVAGVERVVFEDVTRMNVMRGRAPKVKIVETGEGVEETSVPGVMGEILEAPSVSDVIGEGLEEINVTGAIDEELEAMSVTGIIAGGLEAICVTGMICAVKVRKEQESMEKYLTAWL
jgi:hypothetical protein